MSHRKIRSQGYVPFSWEEEPGVPKSNHQKSSSDVGLSALKTLPGNDLGSPMIPPPPCASQPRKKSYWCKGLRWQDDPFLAAFKSCTKTTTASYHRGHQEFRQKSGESEGKNYRKGSVFSCKHSSNVENDNLVKFSKLPPLPKERYNAKSFVRTGVKLP